MLGVIVFAIGASVGSFLNVVADRLPAGTSLVSPRSRSPSCEKPLSNTELVPIFSYLWLRGKCRHCGTGIPVRVLLVEAITAVLFTSVYVRFGYGIPFVVVSAGVSLLIVIAVIDLEHRLILNRIVFPSLIILLVLAPFWPQLEITRALLGSTDSLASLANSLAAGLGAFLIFLVVAMAYPQGMGGGDVKLAGLLGLLLGFPGVLIALWVAIVGGGGVAIALLATRRKGRKDAIPFGPYLSTGGIVTLLLGTDTIPDLQGLVDSAVGL